MKLDEKKKETLPVAWEQVTKDFGAIFSTLLPGTKAKLQPPDGQTVVDGIEVKVAIRDDALDLSYSQKVRTHSNPQPRQTAESRRKGQFAYPSQSKVTEIITPIPSNVQLQKKRPVCFFFTFEGHGDHYINCQCGVNYAGVVIVSLMSGLATGVPMSHPHGWYQTATPMSYYTDQTYATTGYYTTKSPVLECSNYLLFS
ncbi:hypothetical protein DAPPUDRAFT_236938 [Daphnia pulex]|uniref:Uncharacterized protein n=1 Tax=Daphnia pulex TaxID=6669 RepID=E9G2B8_DAPPU|nr:hypothetical protein DAPPUDRAFT_236938 [Daphnia pulex]|eukprot:EFX86333.1 hypothetical protein DAPPUDRAFT_236938 [Daphnia pulex]